MRQRKTRRMNRSVADFLASIPFRQGLSWVLLVTAVALAAVALGMSGTSANLALETLQVSGCANLTDTKLLGNVTCATPIEAACIDISGQGCAEPLQADCLPDSVGNWNITGNLTLSGVCTSPLDPSCVEVSSSQVTCDAELGQGCIPQDLTLNSLVVQNLTAYNFTHINMMEMNQTDLTVNNLLVGQSMTCGMPGVINETCISTVPASKVTCSSPLDQGCIPNVPSSKVTCDATLGAACIDISGETCSSPVAIGCIPSVPSSKVTCDIALGATCVDISGETCSSPVDIGCVPSVPSSKVTCDVALGAACVDISGETCSAPVDASCIPGQASKYWFDQTDSITTSTTNTVYGPLLSMAVTVPNAGAYYISFNGMMETMSQSDVISAVIELNGVQSTITTRTIQSISLTPDVLSLQQVRLVVAADSTIRVLWRSVSGNQVFSHFRSLIVMQQ